MNPASVPDEFELFDHVPVGVCVVDERYSIVCWNRILEEWTGIDRSEVLQTNLLSRFEHLAQDRYRSRLENVLGGGPPAIFSHELHPQLLLSARADAGLRAQKTTASSLTAGTPPKGMLLLTVEDLTEPEGTLDKIARLREQALGEIEERKRAERALSEQKRRLDITLRSIGDGVITTDVNGRVGLMSRTAEQLTGWRVSEARGKPIEEIYRTYCAKTGQQRRSPARETLEKNRIFRSTGGETLMSKDGTQRHIDESAAPITDGSGAAIGAVLVFQDITERIRVEKELLKARKLESIGILAGGIAHDFNNLLTAIMGSITLAKMHMDPKDKACQVLENADAAANRAKKLIQHLVTFADGGAPIKRPALIGEIVTEAARSALNGSAVECRLVGAEEPARAEVDREQIKWAVHNIITNAEQAMSGQGKIDISIGSGVFEPVIAGERRIENYIKISVTDEGVGIQEEHLGKIFDPFFSTKEKECGLGLSTAYSIVARHGGTIEVDSKPGRDTVFHIYLPAGSAKDSPETAGAKRNARSRRILVMDDEELLRDITAKLLRALGHEALSARDGEEMLRLYAEARDAANPFHAVIMDLTIENGMGGKEAVARLLQMDPEAKAIVSSGYSADSAMSDFRRYGFCNVLIKPYELSRLKKVLSDLDQG